MVPCHATKMVISCGSDEATSLLVQELVFFSAALTTILPNLSKRDAAYDYFK